MELEKHNLDGFGDISVKQQEHESFTDWTRFVHRFVFWWSKNVSYKVTVDDDDDDDGRWMNRKILIYFLENFLYMCSFGDGVPHWSVIKSTENELFTVRLFN